MHSSAPLLWGWNRRASWPRADAGVCFAVCVLCSVCVHASMVAGEGARDCQSCSVMLCSCFVSQLSAGCRARTVGPAPSPADVPARPAGWGEPARQVLTVLLPSRLPASGLLLGRSSLGSSRTAMGLSVLCPQTDPLAGHRDQHCGSSTSLV